MPTDPVIRDSLTTKAEIINLEPTLSLSGTTATLSSTTLPEIKVITYEPTKVISTDLNFDPVLTETIKTSTTLDPTRTTTTSTITSTICSTCLQSLSLIKP
jgi:hypothetical protein